MNSHYATVDVWVGSLDGEDEAETIVELIESALSGAGYQATVTATAHEHEEARP